MDKAEDFIFFDRRKKKSNRYLVDSLTHTQFTPSLFPEILALDGSQLGNLGRTVLNLSKPPHSRSLPSLGSLYSITGGCGYTESSPLGSKWHKPEKPPQLQSSLWDWVKAFVELPSQFSSFQCRILFLSLTHKCSSSEAFANKYLSQSLFPMEPNLDRVIK